MGFAIFTLAGALRPFRRLWAAACGRPARHAVLRPTGMHSTAGRAHVAWPSARSASQGRRPLRVLRVVDAGHAPSTAGRMVISGRMADVCAELDRLAALEAAAA